MNKQSLKYILYALLALLIIISLFNCSQNKDTVEHLSFGRYRKPLLSWYRAPKMPKFNFRMPTMPSTPCPNGKYLTADRTKWYCETDAHYPGGQRRNQPFYGEIDMVKSKNCPKKKMWKNGQCIDCQTLGISGGRGKSNGLDKRVKFTPQAVLDQCGCDIYTNKKIETGYGGYHSSALPKDTEKDFDKCDTKWSSLENGPHTFP